MSIIKKAPDEGAQRNKLQFPIVKDVCYQCLKRGRISTAGVGKTLQISSREVRFTTLDSLRQGEKVRMVVDWPAMLDNVCLLKLEICGSVIRSVPGAAAVKIARYQFRTRGATLSVARSLAPLSAAPFAKPAPNRTPLSYCHNTEYGVPNATSPHETAPTSPYPGLS